MAQASGTKTGSRHAPPVRRRRRGLEVGGLVIGILAGLGITLGWLISTRGQPPRPVVFSTHPPVQVHGAPAVPGASAEPDPAALNAQWAAYSNHASCADWAGGDGVSAIRLNSSQLAWFFSDTYLGPASPTGGFSHLSGFMHNSLVVQTKTGTGSAFVTLTGGGACPGPGRPGDAAPVVGPPPTASGVSADRYWEEDGIRTGGTIVKFYNHYLGGTVPYVPDGTVIASFGVGKLGSAGQAHQYGGVARPDLITLPSYTPPAGGTPILWGASLLRTGNTVYIYGTQSPKLSAPGHLLYLARVPVSQLTAFSAWHFYAGAGTWSAAQSDARPIQAGVGGSPDIDAYPASTPSGPFDFTAGRLLYRDPAIGLDAAHDYRILYEARAEPALSTRNSLVISYNVNSEAVTTGCAPMSAFTNTLTLPRFVAVPMAAFGAGAGAHASQAKSGPAGYPQIVQQNPSQWFDAWSYTDGCPPVPALTSARARPAVGRVTLNWPDAGLRLRYHVYLRGPGEPGDAPVKITLRTGVTITGLQPGDYQATVMPVNFKKQTGRAAKVTFTVP